MSNNVLYADKGDTSAVTTPKGYDNLKSPGTMHINIMINVTCHELQIKYKYLILLSELSNAFYTLKIGCYIETLWPDEILLYNSYWFVLDIFMFCCKIVKP